MSTKKQCTNHVHTEEADKARHRSVWRNIHVQRRVSTAYDILRAFKWNDNRHEVAEIKIFRGHYFYHWNELDEELEEWCTKNWCECNCCGEWYISPTPRQDHFQHWYCDGLSNSDRHSADVIFAPKIQAIARGVIARNHVLPAMLSADPDDLTKAVHLCINGLK